MFILAAVSSSLAGSSPMVHGVFFLQFTTTVFMTGLIWFVQVVHYPLFRSIAPVEFSEYHRLHSTATGRLVAFPMMLELATAGILLLLQPSLLSNYFYTGSLVLLAVIWISTFVLQVSDHRNLRRNGNGRNAVRILLIRSWIRTFAWTGRACLLAAIIVESLAP